ncbi:MAG TPA: chemotaxis response regulator protein-glutamate methylesterase [Verrucomicrobiae bacterium]|nr:chemotaxis response regulator protein-glutamate methylesterase [Verrucomicrobiae bacterium]
MSSPTTTTRRIRVLIVDDSALARTIIAKSLAPFADIEVVGTAVDPYVARDLIIELKPDVITLDIEMPRMDGISFLKVLMRHRPMPVIILSSLTAAASEKALEALQAGAVDVMEKPSGSYSAHSDGTHLANKIRAAAHTNIRVRVQEVRQIQTPPQMVRRPAATSNRSFPARRLILLGASTGGTQALKEVLMSMNGDLPGICIVQHIPAYFSKAFADRLNQTCQMEVREAKHGDVVRAGLALIAPGGYHLVIKWKVDRYLVELNQSAPIHYQCPAVDILFESAVKAGAGPYTAAALLTGMGVDGAAGLLHLREAGASTIAQDEASSIVFGMPREAIRLGAAQQVLPLDQIGLRLEQLASAPSDRPESPVSPPGNLRPDRASI